MAEFRVLIGSRSFGRSDRGAWNRLEKAGCELIPNRSGRAYTESELLDIIGDVDAIITGTDGMTARVIEAARRLKVISKHGVGVDNIDLQAARQRGITVTVTPGVMDDSVADLTVALVLNLARHVVAAHNATVQGRWNVVQGMELKGKAAGIVGLGRIGKKVTLRLKAFGMRIIAFDPYPDEQFAKEHDVQWKSLEELLKSSDVVCLHAPGGKQVLDTEAIETMKHGALVINAARGDLIDETALYNALKTGRLGGAGLDVFAEEPPTGSPLLALENVIVTPHMAGLTKEALIRMGEMAAENVLRVLRGEEPLVKITP